MNNPTTPRFRSGEGNASVHLNVYPSLRGDIDMETTQNVSSAHQSCAVDPARGMVYIPPGHNTQEDEVWTPHRYRSNPYSDKTNWALNYMNTWPHGKRRFKKNKVFCAL